MNYADELLGLNRIRKNDKFHSYKGSFLGVDGLKDKDKGDFDIDLSDEEGISEKEEEFDFSGFDTVKEMDGDKSCKPISSLKRARLTCANLEGRL